jgi:hypothetical protein
MLDSDNPELSLRPWTVLSWLVCIHTLYFIFIHSFC